MGVDVVLIWNWLSVYGGGWIGAWTSTSSCTYSRAGKAPLIIRCWTHPVAGSNVWTHLKFKGHLLSVNGVIFPLQHTREGKKWRNNNGDKDILAAHTSLESGILLNTNMCCLLVTCPTPRNSVCCEYESFRIFNSEMMFLLYLRWFSCLSE